MFLTEGQASFTPAEALSQNTHSGLPISKEGSSEGCPSRQKIIPLLNFM